MKLSAKTLRFHDACETQVARFEELFGNADVDVTEAACIAVTNNFFPESWSWLARQFFGVSGQAKYECVRVSAWTEYLRVVTPALVVYQCAVATARTEHLWVEIPVPAEYTRAIAAANAEYDRAVASAAAEYARTLAGAFGRLAEEVQI